MIHHAVVKTNFSRSVHHFLRPPPRFQTHHPIHTMAEDGEPKNDDVAMGSSDEDEDYNPGEWGEE